ncbi:hypothetical protein [Levilactobacillus tujiorum]|uniref:XRE family transcriptional regulator n=1 Tax=Levilactobacillus tujiorum TaxID=2912243 RepID=A0ABX1L6J1_9LACO|nr:hypothetical protein [Levilactobacillus tujiorum]MCH5465270.1 hypothetical protein [Levilactobacillus tujiorum]NLR12261.1 hypothetical protein [Lactobacillus sp. HBUAS51387]NLR30273.1 hypothetical protein [Levilactobacillus tujiorum]NLR33027.1 hypothetical protein [Levilactobacillus tujiorum]
MEKIDLVSEIRELLDSDLTPYQIGKDTGLSVDLIRRLKVRVRPIERVSVGTAQTLLDYKRDRSI